MTERNRVIEIIEKARLEAVGTIGSMNDGFAAWYADKLIESGVVSVVRCGSCKHYTDFDTNNHKRLKFHFCSFGERKELNDGTAQT